MSAQLFSDTEIPPIRTVDQYHASVAEWDAAMICSTQTDDANECKRADEVCVREEGRWDECRHLFEFDDFEGTLIGLKSDKANSSDS